MVVTGDDGMMVTEFAPYGVIGSITPTTNPTSTIINNSIAMVSAGNAVTFNVHPSAKRVSVENVQLLNRAIVGAGRSARSDHGHPQPDAGVGQGADEPPRCPGAAGHRWSRRRARGAADVEEGDHRGPGQSAGRGRPDGRHRGGGPRHRARRLVRQQRHLHGREDHDRGRHGGRPSGARHGGQRGLPAQGARAQAPRAGDLQGARSAEQARDDQPGVDRQGRRARSSPRSASRSTATCGCSSPRFPASTAWCGPSR